MRNFRSELLARFVVASLAIVAAVFVAHLGAEAHAEECRACEIAATGFAEPQGGSPSIDPGNGSVIAYALGDVAVVAAPHCAQGPRAPPAS